jgi:phospholipid N-methyltransferase
MFRKPNTQTDKVTAKKQLGQHFLTDKGIAQRIGELMVEDLDGVMEIGPGMGVMTQSLFAKWDSKLTVVEIDKESVEYLGVHFSKLDNHIISKDFLKYDLNEVFNGEPFAIIGNFPYNISTQIVFKTLEIKYTYEHKVKALLYNSVWINLVSLATSYLSLERMFHGDWLVMVFYISGSVIGKWLAMTQMENIRNKIFEILNLKNKN